MESVWKFLEKSDLEMYQKICYSIFSILIHYSHTAGTQGQNPIYKQSSRLNKKAS